MTVIIPIAVIVVVLAWLYRPGRGTFKARRVPILATVVPLFVVAVIALVYQSLQNSAGVVSDISNGLFIAGLCLTGAALLAFIGFAVARKAEITKGIGFGLTVMVLLSIVVFVSLEALAGV